jgi:16S rRNA (guanine1516-N2)-methyltransferase
MPPATPVVTFTDPAQEARAREITRQLGDAGRTQLAANPGMQLHLNAGVLELHSGLPGELPLSVTFSPARGRPASVRAVLADRQPAPLIIDATAGLGQDAFDFASAGSQVIMLERSPVIAALLADGLQRARSGQDPRVATAAARLSLRTGDALQLLPQLAPADVVYLDPMFQISAAQAGKRKSMRMFHALVGPDADAGALLAVARAAASRRVVVKRSRRAPHLADTRPSGSLAGRTVRFDLYAPT